MSQDESPATDRGRPLGWLIVGILVIVALSALLIPGLLRDPSAAGPSVTPTPTAAGPSAPPTGASPSASPPVDLPTPLPLTPSVYPTPPPGSTDAPVPIAPIEVGIEEAAEPSAGVEARVEKIESVEGVGDPGETSGPAIRVTVVIENTSGASLSLAGATVNLSYGPDDRPASPVSKPGVVMFPASVQEGEVASGTYVFSVPLSAREEIRVTLDTSAGLPMVVFTGMGPG